MLELTCPTATGDVRLHSEERSCRLLDIKKFFVRVGEMDQLIKWLALKARGLEFGFLALMQTAGCSGMARACNPSTRETRTGTSLVLVSQSV